MSPGIGRPRALLPPLAYLGGRADHDRDDDSPTFIEWPVARPIEKRGIHDWD